MSWRKTKNPTPLLVARGVNNRPPIDLWYKNLYKLLKFNQKYIKKKKNSLPWRNSVSFPKEISKNYALHSSCVHKIIQKIFFNFPSLFPREGSTISALMENIISQFDSLFTFTRLHIQNYLNSSRHCWALFCRLQRALFVAIFGQSQTPISCT